MNQRPRLQFRDQALSRMQGAQRERQARLYLVAAMLAVHTPLTKMLTVVGQQPVVVLAYTGTRPADHLRPFEFRCYVRHDCHTVSGRKARERNLFHRSPAQSSSESRVVHDLSSSHIDSMVYVTATLSDNVRTHRRFWLGDQKPLGPM